MGTGGTDLRCGRSHDDMAAVAALPNLDAAFSEDLSLSLIHIWDIGYAIAKVAMALDMKVLAYRRNPVREWECGQLRFVDLDTLLRESDIISTNCPLTDETRYIINRDSISRMKDGVILILSLIHI